ncbi:uroporphyrinogen-III C-methyltransferase [Thermospira aquatica]|uniref:Hydroxymethylbilane synthase n=1 Tax=Thermospira aquatica TaxID=2828656 RepID=A0AAX3BAH1_9SPIR|nr:uroporphyrinogen-III C-methyltransferase [Thermospira aquatica]URA09222.1 uroporphyrinogen-III C-methyltransferase [Thermospira aquatica]
METIKVIARNSPLSLKQVEEVFSELPEKLEYQLIPILSYGDKHKKISLMRKDLPQDFFTKELDEAILLNKADVAIHSAKDLPFPLPYNISLIALTKGKSQEDALVSRNNRKLLDLPPRAKIGVSSPARKAQILGLRKDLKVVPIRGTIEERIALVDQGKVDAIVVALCALERLHIEDKIAEILPFETHPLQGKLAVTARSDRPELRKLFFSIDERRFYGKVYIVGGGPGDPSLLTLKAKECLSYADVVLYDDLINPEVLSFAHSAKKLIYVGKRNRKHFYEQNEINKQLYQYALEGKRVVRLHGGDPLLFGRAQEEIDYLLQRFVSVEVINGITSAIAAAADATLSLTNRKYGSRIIIESGHLKGKEHKKTISSYIFYMGSTSKKEITSHLRHIFPETCPVLFVQDASLPQQKIATSTIEKLPSNNFTSPLIIIAGNVAKHVVPQEQILYTGLHPFETLSNIPGKILHYPLIQREKMDPSNEIVPHLYDVLVFTSEFAAERWTTLFGITKHRIYAIGPRTRERLLTLGYQDVFLPPTFDSFSLAELLKIKESSSKILYPCSLLSNNSITKLPNVTPLPLYKTIPLAQKKLDLRCFNGIYFASGSCVDAFLKIYEKIPPHFIIYVGGNTTFKKLAELGEEKRTIILEKSL